MIKTTFIRFILLMVILASPLHGEEGGGGIILAFDDGYPSWTRIIAPELQKAGAVATGFVNNQRIHSGSLSFNDLRLLRDRCGWEIGTHTYHHFHAPDFVKQKGIAVWLKEELEASLAELASEGLKTRSLAFPFNDFNDSIEKEAMKRVENFRRPNAFPILNNTVRDGSYPATSFELASYVPLDLVFQWIDFARQQNRYIFLFGHKVLPDEEFLTGTVAWVSERAIGIGKTTNPIQKDRELCLVPDIRRRIYGPPIKVAAVEDEKITLLRTDMARLTKPGASFMLGECYAAPVSYFRKLLDYAAEKLPFFTVSQALQRVSSYPKQQKTP